MVCQEKMNTIVYMGNCGVNQDFKPIFKLQFKRLTLRLRSKQQLYQWLHGKIGGQDWSMISQILNRLIGLQIYCETVG